MQNARSLRWKRHGSCICNPWTTSKEKRWDATAATSTSLHRHHHHKHRRRRHRDRHHIHFDLHHLHTSAIPFPLLTWSSSQAPPPEVLDKTFGQLLDQTASSSNYQGLLVEDELEGLTTPFVQELMTKVRIP
jgi:hypothetical protein